MLYHGSISNDLMSLIRYSKHLRRHPVHVMIARSSNFRTAADAIFITHRATSFQNGEFLKRTDNTQQEKTGALDMTNLSEENLNELLKAMKIGFYKDFRKRGLLTDEQLEMLIIMQGKPVKGSA